MTFFVRCSASRLAPAQLLLSVFIALLGAAGWGLFGVDRAKAQTDGGEALPFSNSDAGALEFDAALGERLQARWKNRRAGYEPRTRHLLGDGRPKFTNRLFLESSPYLQQHAHNPVNWYPWGDEAFETAQRLGRPLLLSVGYSTCHWCHVMEEESFEDLEIARFLNENYVAVKVDREERPDIDGIYMAAVQALTGGGGWPMTVWLTPEREPFYGGTYFPARDGDHGVDMGFLTLLKAMREAYDSQPENVAKNAATFVSAIGEQLAPAAGEALPGVDVLRKAAAYYEGQFDAVEGGTRGAPKFPSGLSPRFLLRYHRRSGEKQYLEMTALTLQKMARGGIYDQVGGGFHRYATDARWLVPHFEKMLYDNALLTVAYLEGFQATGREEFAAVAREILRYVERDMTSPEGAFYSATDADSLDPEGERGEGWYFTWAVEEIDAALTPPEAALVKAYYGVTASGNFEDRNVLHVTGELAKVAAGLDLKESTARQLLAGAREKLYQARKLRPAPLRDEKILTSWNGLMISAHAFAALVLGEPAYAERGGKAAEFVLAHLRRQGRLLRSFKDGEARHKGYLDDYAFLTAALIDLYEATGKIRWLREAIALDKVLEEHYEDTDKGGFFLTSKDHEALLAREKPNYDGAEPSGNSVAVLNLLRLYEFTTRESYRERAERALRAFEPILSRSPAALSEMLLALDWHLDTPKEIVIVTPESRDQAAPLLDALRTAFVPNRVLAVVGQQELTGEPDQTSVIPLLEAKRALRGRPTAYVCERRVCELPASDPAVFSKQIHKTEPYGDR